MVSFLMFFCALGLHPAGAHLDPKPAVSHVRYSSIWTGLDAQVSLSLSRGDMVGDRPELVTVTWWGLAKAAGDAWVGLYLTSDDHAAVVPLKFQFCNSSRGPDPGGGHGSLSFEVLNYRSDVVFRLFHGWEAPQLLAESSVLAVRKPEYPTGLRIALTGVPEEVAVTWNGAPIFDDDDAGPRVEFAVHDAMGRLVAQGSALAEQRETYSRSEMCGGPAAGAGYRDPGVFFTARIAGLQPGGTVRYRVGSRRAWSQRATFRAPVHPGAPVKIFAFGDLGQKPRDDSSEPCNQPWWCPYFARGDPGALNTTAKMLADHLRSPADLVVHNGDLSYAMGYTSEWESFHGEIEPLSSQVPWMVTVGNHERDWPGTNSTRFGGDDSLGECGIPTMRRFAAMPFASRQRPPLDEPWYVLTVGVVQLVAISTEHDLAPGSRQHEFLAAALGDVDRSRTPWVVLAGHRPYHVDSDWVGDAEFCAYFQQATRRLVEEGAVDLILGGHHHSYQRTCKVSGNQCVAGASPGVVVWNVGMAGAGLNRINATRPEIFQYADAKNYGYGRITADTEKLLAEFVLSSNGSVADSVTLVKPAVIFS